MEHTIPSVIIPSVKIFCFVQIVSVLLQSSPRKRLTSTEYNDLIFNFFVAWTWFQSGINTDGAHNPVTSRKLQKGDIISINCFPMISG